jgi:hypothetical protein
MSPPEVWGPAVWNLFHTLCERLNEDAFSHVAPSLFNMIVRICKFLPCPDCAADASNFLSNVRFTDLKNKTELKNLFYLFHNKVNFKKRKPLFNYANLSVYSNYNLIHVINTFIINYNTKGNMKLLSESFQRQFVLNDFKKWIKYVIRAFMPMPKPLPAPEPVVPIEEVKVVEEPVVVEQVVVEEAVIVEELVVEEAVIVEESVVEEAVIVEAAVVEKSKKGKKGKNKK